MDLVTAITTANSTESEKQSSATVADPDGASVVDDSSFDAEFGIPPIDKLPTLESILNEDIEENVSFDSQLVSNIDQDTASSSNVSNPPVEPSSQTIPSVVSATNNDVAQADRQRSTTTDRPSNANISGAQAAAEGASNITTDSKAKTTSAETGLTSNQQPTPEAPRDAGVGGVTGQSVAVKAAKRAATAISAHLLKLEELMSLRNQIASAIDRVDAGTPSAIGTAYNGMLAVGTSHGLVLIFDTSQILKFCVGNRNVGREYGGVSCLSFNRDSTRLLVGYAKGQMTMWDVTNGKLLRNMMEAHQNGTAVLHVRFTDDPTVAICNDSGGSVYALHFTRLIGRSWETVCLFSGSRGEVCAIEPLTLIPNFKDHPLSGIGMLAMASFSKIYVVTLVPEMTVRFTHPLRGDANTLPLLDWRMQVVAQPGAAGALAAENDPTEVSVQPLLAFARDRVLNLVQVVYRSDEEILFKKQRSLEFPFQLIAIRFVNQRTLVAIDTYERLHVVDYRSEETLTTVSLDAVQLVYSSSHFKAIATGSNVSRALALAAERACYQSIAFDPRDSRILLLGMRTVYSIIQQRWDQRVDLLVKEDKFREALELCKACFDGTAKAVVGLSGARRRETVAAKMTAVLADFVDAAMKRLCPERGNYAALRKHYESLVPILVDYSLLLSSSDVLFDLIFKKLRLDPIANDVFLDSLDRYVADGQLTNVPSRVVSELLRHYQATRRVDKLEAVLTHLDCSELDIQHLLNVCRQLSLDNAFIHLYTNVLGDYVTPLRELLDRLRAALSRVRFEAKRLPEETIHFGNRLLVYLGSSLCGRAYPTGDIPPAFAGVVREQIYDLLVTVRMPRRDAAPTGSSSKTPANARDTSLVESDGGDYPYVRTLLHFDVRNFLNVLALVFDDAQLGATRRQQLMDVLLHLMTETLDFTPEQIGVLFIFAARQMARHPRSIKIPKTLLDQIVEYLCTIDEPVPDGEQSDADLPHSNLLVSEVEDGAVDGRQRSITFAQSVERQQVLIDLLSANSPVRFDERWILSLAERARFYRLCEFIYERQRRFDKVLTCFLRDAVKRDAVFIYAENILAGEQYTEREKQALRAELLSSAELLLSIDAERFVQLTAPFASLDKMLDLLAGNPESIYRYLRAFFRLREAVTSQQQVPDSLTSPAVKQSSVIAPVSPETHEAFIELLCHYESESSVLRYLQSHETPPFRTQQAILICERAGYLECVGYLYESIEDIGRAAQIHRTNLDARLRNAFTTLLNTKPDDGRPVDAAVVEKSYNDALECVHSLVISIMQFCQRVSRRLDEKARQSVWFALFDTVKQAYASVKDFQSPDELRTKWIGLYINELKTLTSDVLNMMVSHVSLPVVLHKFIQDPLYSVNRFGEIRDLIIGMLETYNYERTLLDACCSMMTRDLLRQMRRLQSTARSHFPVRKLRCSVCRKAMAQEADAEDCDLVFFKCGHIYHRDCIHSYAASQASSGDGNLMNTWQSDEDDSDGVVYRRSLDGGAPAWRCPFCLALGISHSERPTSAISVATNVMPIDDAFGSASRAAQTSQQATVQRNVAQSATIQVDPAKYTAFRRLVDMSNSVGSDRMAFLSELKGQKERNRNGSSVNLIRN